MGGSNAVAFLVEMMKRFSTDRRRLTGEND
jgi:hypothetical protein